METDAKIDTYTIVTAQDQMQLVEVVNAMIVRGWQPVGPFWFGKVRDESLTPSPFCEGFAQTMVHSEGDPDFALEDHFDCWPRERKRGMLTGATMANAWAIEYSHSTDS